jgi:hypothetical protein
VLLTSPGILVSNSAHDYESPKNIIIRIIIASRIPYSGLWNRVDLENKTDVSEEHASIFMVEEITRARKF